MDSYGMENDRTKEERGAMIPVSNAYLAGVTTKREPPSFFVECWQNDYAEYFLHTLREKEAKRPVTSLSSPQLIYRGYLILKMQRVTNRLGLSGRVLHAGVRILDVFMDAYIVNEDNLLHVALICLLIAIKFEVKGAKAPRFSEICDEAEVESLSQAELWNFEWNILQHIKWDLCTPTTATFAEFFIPFGVSKEEFDEWSRKQDKDYVSFDKFKLLLKHRIKSFVHLTLSNMQLAKKPPSLVAAACIQATRTLFGLSGWSQVLHKVTLYQLSAIESLAVSLRMMMVMKNKQPKRRYSETVDDQGYCTEVSSPSSSVKMSRNSLDS